MHSIHCQLRHENQLYKRALELQRSGSFSGFDQPTISTNVIQSHFIDNNVAQRHNPRFATSSWPPELPRSYVDRQYRLSPVKHEEDKANISQKLTRSKSTQSGSSDVKKPRPHSQKQSQMNQYEQSKEFHSVAQSIIQDNRWQRIGRLAATAAGYGAIKAYDKCKSFAGRVRNKCNAAYQNVRQRFSRGARDQ